MGILQASEKEREVSQGSGSWLREEGARADDPGGAGVRRTHTGEVGAQTPFPRSDPADAHVREEVKLWGGDFQENLKLKIQKS